MPTSRWRSQIWQVVQQQRQQLGQHHLVHLNVSCDEWRGVDHQPIIGASGVVVGTHLTLPAKTIAPRAGQQYASLSLR